MCRITLDGFFFVVLVTPQPIVDTTSPKKLKSGGVKQMGFTFLVNLKSSSDLIREISAITKSSS